MSHRNTDLEREFLRSLCSLDYVLLQRDWESQSHGDLDLVLRATHWPKLLRELRAFIAERGLVLAKAYEIEHGVVCLVVLAADSEIHLDIALAPVRPSLFGVALDRALDEREIIDEIFVMSDALAAQYTAGKRRYKASQVRKWHKRISNFPTILRRAKTQIVWLAGGLRYIPRLSDATLLRSAAILSRAEISLRRLESIYRVGKES